MQTLGGGTMFNRWPVNPIEFSKLVNMPLDSHDKRWVISENSAVAELEDCDEEETPATAEERDVPPALRGIWERRREAPPTRSASAPPRWRPSGHKDLFFREVVLRRGDTEWW